MSRPSAARQRGAGGLPVVDRRSWPVRDPRWITPAAVAAVLGVLGVIDVAALSGLAAELGAEAAFGGAVAAVITSGVSLHRAWTGRADDDVVDPPVAPGPLAVLTSRGAHLGLSAGDAVATIAHGDTTLATLHLHGWGADSEAGTVATVTARMNGETLGLEHRRGESGDAERPGDDPPDLVVRLVDGHGRARAGAHVHRAGSVEDWTVPSDGHVLRFRVDPHRRPNRRTLLDATGKLDTGARRVHPLRIARPTRRLTFDPPADLSPAAVVLCLWLSHLLDAHARAGWRWNAPDTDWTTVEDDFPLSVGPGGFGDPRPRVSGSSGAGGGGS